MPSAGARAGASGAVGWRGAVVGGDGVPVVVAGQQVEGGVRERGWDVLTALRRVLGSSRAAPGGGTPG